MTIVSIRVTVCHESGTKRDADDPDRDKGAHTYMCVWTIIVLTMQNVQYFNIFKAIPLLRLLPWLFKEF